MRKFILAVLMTGCIASLPVIVSADTVFSLAPSLLQVADSTTSNQPSATNDVDPNDNAAPIDGDDNLAMPNGGSNDEMSSDTDGDDNADSAGLSSDDDSVAAPSTTGVSK